MAKNQGRITGGEGMNDYVYVKESRYPPPRQGCIDAGFDYIHEGPDYTILAGEYHCPDCRQRLPAKRKLIQDAALLDELRRANDLKEHRNQLQEQGLWREPEVQVVRQYTPYRPQTPQQPKSKGGIPL